MLFGRTVFHMKSYPMWLSYNMGNSSLPSYRQLVCGPNAIEVEIRPIWKLLFKEVSKSDEHLVGQVWSVLKTLPGHTGMGRLMLHRHKPWKKVGEPPLWPAHIPGRRLHGRIWSEEDAWCCMLITAKCFPSDDCVPSWRAIVWGTDILLCCRPLFPTEHLPWAETSCLTTEQWHAPGVLVLSATARTDHSHISNSVLSCRLLIMICSENFIGTTNAHLFLFNSLVLVGQR